MCRYILLIPWVGLLWLADAATTKLFERYAHALDLHVEMDGAQVQPEARLASCVCLLLDSFDRKDGEARRGSDLARKNSRVPTCSVEPADAMSALIAIEAIHGHRNKYP